MENAGGYYPAFLHKHNAPIDRKSLSVAAALTSSKKKREDSCLLSVPLSEALELPFGVERTTQKPHAEYTTTFRPALHASA